MQVLNLSLGHPIYERAASDPMVQAVESAVRAGLVVVVAAGNVGLIPRHASARILRHRLARQCAIGFLRRRGAHA